jgi:hypothetical protein
MHPGDPEVIASQEYIVCAGGLQVFSQPAPAKSSAATQDARLPRRNRERDSLPRFMLMRLSDTAPRRQSAQRSAVQRREPAWTAPASACQDVTDYRQ